MKFYFACIGMMFASYPEQLRYLMQRGFHELRSYAEIRGFNGHTLRIYGDDYFVDSGAFSLKSRDVPITIEEYTDFLLRYRDQIHIYANFDCIPKSGTTQAATSAAEETLQNQKYMEARGLRPLPVFHKGEPLGYLQYYVDNYGYICIGGLVDRFGTNRQFFNLIWRDYLSNPDGTPRLKVHSFGLSQMKYLLAYPWYSTDSSAWLIWSKYGFVAIPVRKNGSYDYEQKPHVIAVSNETSQRQVLDGHIDTVAPAKRAEVLEYFQSRGWDLDLMRRKPVFRFIPNIEFYLDFQKQATFCTAYEPRQMTLGLE